MMNDMKLSPGDIVRRCLWVLFCVGGLALDLFLSYLRFSDFAAVVRLQPALCTITSVQINTTSFDSDIYYESETYTPALALTLSIPRGQSYQTIADNLSFSSSEAAQAYVAHYQVKHTYPCWYSSQRPTLVRLSQELTVGDYVDLVVGIVLLVVSVIAVVVYLWCFFHWRRSRRA